MTSVRQPTLTNPSKYLLISIIGLVSFGLALVLAIAITPITWSIVGWLSLAAVGGTLVIHKIRRWNQ